MALLSVRHVLTVAVLLLAGLQAGSGQDLQLQYDFFTGDVTYFRYYVDGKTYQTTDNTVGKGARVVVRVVNLNQNIYSVNSLSTGRPIELPPGTVDLLEALREARKASVDPSVSPSRDRWDVRLAAAQARQTEAARHASRALAAGARNATDVSVVAKGMMSRIKGQEGQFRAALARFYTTVDQVVGRAAPLRGLLEATAESRNMTETAVKRQVIDLLQTVLGDAPQGRTAGFSVGDIVKYSSAGYSTMSTALSDVEKIFIELDESYEQMLALVEKYPSALGIVVSDTSVSNGFIPVERWIQNDHRREVVDRLESAIGMLDHLRNPWNNYFQEIAELYSAIQAMSFNYQFEVVANDDEVSVPIHIHDRGTRAERARGDAIRLVASRQYNVPVVGGWKVNTSIGISGSYFFRHQVEYGLVDGKISSGLIDRFTPAAAAFIHLYRRTAGPVTIGPVFGIGMSLNHLRAAQFMLGGSIVMGESDRVMISAGMMGGQVEKLSPGYYEGSAIVGSSVPTEEGFDVGLFVGMSYGLFGR